MFYNIGHDSNCPVRGIRVSQEHKDKISYSNKGKLKSDEYKKNITDGKTGIKFSIKHCKIYLNLYKVTNLQYWIKLFVLLKIKLL